MTHTFGPGSCVKCVRAVPGDEITIGNIYFVQDVKTFKSPCNFHKKNPSEVCPQMGLNVGVRITPLFWCSSVFIPWNAGEEDIVRKEESPLDRALAQRIEAMEDSSIIHRHPLHRLPSLP